MIGIAFSGAYVRTVDLALRSFYRAAMPIALVLWYLIAYGLHGVWKTDVLISECTFSAHQKYD
jgi:RsiW-degrading membrane proteinase PrsW (M82 family)